MMKTHRLTSSLVIDMCQRTTNYRLGINMDGEKTQADIIISDSYPSENNKLSTHDV